MDALPAALVEQIKANKVDLNDPATTLALIKLKSVLSVVGTFDAAGKMTKVGLTCAVCHSTVDDAFSAGIGHRLDGFGNRDLNPGAIIAATPNVSLLAKTLEVDLATVKKVLASWGPGRFDALLDKDGKAMRPDGKQAGRSFPTRSVLPASTTTHGRADGATSRTGTRTSRTPSSMEKARSTMCACRTKRSIQ
jgi:hypothetical protein